MEYIAIRILLASSVGLPAASLCINRRLYQIASAKAIAMGHAEVRLTSLTDSIDPEITAACRNRAQFLLTHFSVFCFLSYSLHCVCIHQSFEQH